MFPSLALLAGLLSGGALLPFQQAEGQEYARPDFVYPFPLYHGHPATTYFLHAGYTLDRGFPPFAALFKDSRACFENKGEFSDLADRVGRVIWRWVLPPRPGRESGGETGGPGFRLGGGWDDGDGRAVE